MDDLSIPKTDKERKHKEIASVLSMARGTVPYDRSFGVLVDIDAAQEVEARVQGVRVASGHVAGDLDGRAKIYLKVIDTED